MTCSIAVYALAPFYNKYLRYAKHTCICHRDVKPLQGKDKTMNLPKLYIAYGNILGLSTIKKKKEKRIEAAKTQFTFAIVT